MLLMALVAKWIDFKEILFLENIEIAQKFWTKVFC